MVQSGRGLLQCRRGSEDGSDVARDSLLSQGDDMTRGIERASGRRDSGVADASSEERGR